MRPGDQPWFYPGSKNVSLCQQRQWPMPSSPHLPLFRPVSYSGLPACLPVMAPQTQISYRLKAGGYCKDCQARPHAALSWVSWMTAKPWYQVDGSVIIISSFVSMGLD